MRDAVVRAMTYSAKKGGEWPTVSGPGDPSNSP